MDLLYYGIFGGAGLVYMCFWSAWILVIEGPELKKKRGEGRYVPQYRFPVLPGMVMLLQAMLVSATFGVFMAGLDNHAEDLGVLGIASIHSAPIGSFLRAMPLVYGVIIFFAACLAAGFRLIGKSFAAGAAGDRS